MIEFVYDFVEENVGGCRKNTMSAVRTVIFHE